MIYFRQNAKTTLIENATCLHIVYDYIFENDFEKVLWYYYVGEDGARRTP